MTLHICLLLAVTNIVLSAPTSKIRHPKSLSYFDYIPEFPNEYDFIVEENDYIEENDLSRAIPTRKRRPTFNSPIYYIRLPPQPYMFVPGLGYISQPPPPPSSTNDFVNLPVSFLSNGKPSTVYQWAGGLGQFPTQPPPTTTVKPPIKDSNVHRLTGQFSFNGKPDDIFVLRDSYNSLYGDTLQNFYP